PSRPPSWRNFFEEGFLPLYSVARSLFSVGEWKWHELTSEDEDPFFDPSMPQYHWRMMSQAISDLLRHYQIMPETITASLKEQDWNEPEIEYCIWIEPDSKRKIRPGERKRLEYPFCGTMRA